MAGLKGGVAVNVDKYNRKLYAFGTGGDLEV
ncbi:MAG: hypothetical protein CM15mV114_360 [Caudoviricetes sp.]|nr:MAG: hypothetical protein CM15mV114_360 [Caudoviricetes sp.]